MPREGWLIAAKVHDAHKSSLATPGQLEVRCKAAATWEQSVVASSEFEFGANWAATRVDAYVRLSDCIIGEIEVTIVNQWGERSITQAYVLPSVL